MRIAGRDIGQGHPPYTIAEISCNHGGSLDRALEMVSAAKAAGADAVKFQCFTADTITIDSNRPEFMIPAGPWKGRNLFELYKKTETPFEWFPDIKAHADKVGIAWFASVFDKTSVDLMVHLDAPAIKIASFEIVDLPLIRYAADTGKPLIISTGMANAMEVRNALEMIPPCPAKKHAILHCVSGYPSPVLEADLARLKMLGQNFFNVEVGISDHSMGPEVPIAAVALGASIIEKHFRLFWHNETEDSPFSLDETDFARMVEQVHNTWHGLARDQAKASEAVHRSLRRSLFAVADIPAGALISDANVRSIRPGHGLPPDAMGQIIGRQASRDIERGEPMQWEMVR